MKKTTRESGSKEPPVKIARHDAQTSTVRVVERFHVIENRGGQVTGLHWSVSMKGVEYQVYVVQGGSLDSVKSGHPSERLAGHSSADHSRCWEAQNTILTAVTVASDIANSLNRRVT